MSSCLIRNYSVHPTHVMTSNGIELSTIKSQWRNLRCDEAKTLIVNNNGDAGGTLGSSEARMVELLCRGPKFTNFQIGELNDILGKMFESNSETSICLPASLDLCSHPAALWSNTYVRTPQGEFFHLHLDNQELPKSGFSVKHPESFNCLKNDPDLEKLMQGDFSPLGDLDCLLPRDLVFRWAWESLRTGISPAVGSQFFEAARIMNIGAQNEGYKDVGETWREELEIPNLEGLSERLLMDVKPLFMALHAVVRHVLKNKFDKSVFFHRDGMLPADLLGDMWGENWARLLGYVLPFQAVDLNARVAETKWTPEDMVRRAEDFYSSLGLPPMTEKFWTRSVFRRSSNVSKCHGSAANMFSSGDFRMIVCAEKTLEDFYVIVHEMGHVEYYMLYENQSPIFQEGANSAVHEAIGDTIWLAMMTPQHLNRLGLVSDASLLPHSPLEPEYLCMLFCNRDLEPHSFADFEALGHKLPQFEFPLKPLNSTLGSLDLSLLLSMALSRIPKTIFAFIVDAVRWEIFSGSSKSPNQVFWSRMHEHLGVKAPGPDSGLNREGFDIGGKFHVADNTPMIRYFLAGFVQMQIYRGLCEVTLFGKVTGEMELPIPLHTCDIYGSKKAGKLLKKALSLGASSHWTEVLRILTGKGEISSNAFLEYFRPIQEWMEELILAFDIPYGWIEPKTETH